MVKKIILIFSAFILIFSAPSFSAIYSENFDDGTLDDGWSSTDDSEIISGEFHFKQGEDFGGYKGGHIIKRGSANELIDFFQADIRVPTLANEFIVGITVEHFDAVMTGYQSFLKIHIPSNTLQATLFHFDKGNMSVVGQENLGTFDATQINTFSTKLNDNSISYGFNGVETELFNGLYHKPDSTNQSNGYVHAHDAESISHVNFYVDNLMAKTIILGSEIEKPDIANRILFDKFSAEHIDGTKWWPREYVCQNLNGQYVSKLGNSSGMGAEVLPGIFRVSLPVENASEIDTIQADITIVEAILDQKSSDSESFACIGGYFYNVNEAEGLNGDIWVSLNIGDRGNGLEAFWEVDKRLSDDSSQWEEIGTGTISLNSPLQIGIPVSVKLSYDGNQTITFLVNGESVNFVGTEEKKRNAQESFKALRVGVNATDGSNSGFISAKFDNVYINNSQDIYDDFSTSTIDSSKWTVNEWVREISDNTLQSIIKGSNSNKQVNTYLSYKNTPYFEAKARIDSDTQLSDGASCIARLQGYFYNDSRGAGSGIDHNSYQGDIFAQVRLYYQSDGTLNAEAFVNRSDMADESVFTELFSHSFDTQILLDTDYVLYIYFENDKLYFGCNDETTVYEIVTPIYPPYGEHRMFRSRLYLDSGESGYLKTQFDDVFIAYDCDGNSEDGICNSPPDKVIHTSPSGITQDTTPTYMWNEDPNATWYRLFVGDSSEEKIYAEWYDASDICSGGNCSVTLDSELLVGEYGWFVKSWNDHGKIWSDGMVFNIQGTDIPPSKVIHTSPSGLLEASASTFTWEEDSAATWYRLWVGYPGDIKIFAQWYEASDICSGGNCTVTTGTEFNVGNYEWYIKSWNDYGKVWSDGMSFSLSDE